MSLAWSELLELLELFSFDDEEFPLSGSFLDWSVDLSELAELLERFASLVMVELFEIEVLLQIVELVELLEGPKSFSVLVIESFK